MQNQHQHHQQQQRHHQQQNQHHRQLPTHNNNHGSSHPQAAAAAAAAAAQCQGPPIVNVFSCRGAAPSLPSVDLGIDLTSVRAEIDKCKRRYHKELWNVLCGTVLASDKNGGGWKKSERDDESSKGSRSVGQGAGVASRRGDTGEGTSDDGHGGEEEEDEEGEEGGDTTDEANENNRQAPASSNAAAPVVRQRPVQRRRGIRPTAAWQDDWRNNGNSGGLSSFLSRIRPEEGVQDWRSADANTSSRSSRASIVGFSDRLALAGREQLHQEQRQEQQRRRSRQRLFFESATAPAVNNSGASRSRRHRSSNSLAPDDDSDDDDSDDCCEEGRGCCDGVDSDGCDGGDSDADTYASRPARFVPMFCGTWGGSGGRRPAGRSSLRPQQQQQQPPQHQHQRASSRGRRR